MVGVPRRDGLDALVPNRALVSHRQTAQADADDLVVLTIVVADRCLDDPPVRPVPAAP